MNRSTLFRAVFSMALAVAVVQQSPSLVAADDSLDADAALALIDAASRAPQSLAGYAFESYKLTERGGRTLREYVLNLAGGVHLVRDEVLIQTRDAAQSDTVFLLNRTGCWMYNEGRLRRLPEIPLLEEVIPRRLNTASRLGVSNGLEYKMERETSYFGIPAVRIEITLARSLIDRLKKDPEIILKAHRALAQRNLSGKRPTGQVEEGEQKLAKAAFPASYVYYIATPSLAFLSWQAFSIDGERIESLSRQKFKVTADLPESLFAITENRERPVIRNGQELVLIESAVHAP